jgi:amino acid adenylation domain-containing protein
MMLDLNERIAGLSPERRALLERALAAKEGSAHTRRVISQRSSGGSSPLSFAQQRLWFLDQLAPGRSVYNIPIALRLLGPLHVEALEAAISEIVRRHEVLRSVVSVQDIVPVQVTQPFSLVTLPITDLTDLSGENRNEEARRLRSEEARRPFDLSSGPLIRASLVRLAQEEHILLLTLHHITSDAWSSGVLVRELRLLYSAFLNDEASPLPDLPIQYADYASWQREWLSGEELERQLGYWKERLSGAPALLELPTDRPRPAVQTFSGAVHRFSLSSELTSGLKAFSQSEGATLFMTLLAGFEALLSRHSGQQDMVIGTPIANRTQPETEGLIGFFVNTLALRADISGDPSFGELIRRVREIALGAYAHQDLPFEKLVEELSPERSMSHSPLFQVMFTLQNVPIGPVRLENLRVEGMGGESVTAKFDMQLGMTERGDQLEGALEYNTDLFDSDRIERMMQHYVTLLKAVVADPSVRLSRLPLLTEPERKQLLVDWTGMEENDPSGWSDRCIHDLFEEQSERTPNAIAVEFEGERLTYAELNARSNQLAHHLRNLGVGPEILVGLLVERSIEMVVGLLSILKAGGAYVPLDPSYPAERLAYMVEDARMPVIVTQRSALDRLPSLPVRPVQTVLLDDLDDLDDLDGLNGLDSVRNTAQAGPANTAYVIYTSGSTGHPKGVLVTHANVTRLMSSTQHWYGFNERDVWTLFHSLAFDFSVWELWGPLLYGGRLVIVPYLVSRSPDAFLRLLRDRGVTILNQTPSAFRGLLQALSESAESAGSSDRSQSSEDSGDLAIRRVIFGGEALEPASLSTWYGLYGEIDDRLINMYGITETTVHVTYRPMLAADSNAGASPGSVIGRPIGDLRTYLLDGRLQPVPIGVPGEIYVGGAGLARGYLNRPDLTAERFVPDPFSTERPGERLYKTGDVGRYLSNGEMVYVGRADQQVKIRGFRIELGEIESVLLDHPSIREAVVLATEDGPENKRLVAYLAGNEGSIDIPVLREHLRSKLPEYMVPSAFMVLDSLPLTSNGKIDRKALPVANVSSVATADPGEFAAPRTPIEEGLCEIWREVLHLEQVGIHDNFFEIGGHSLLAVRLMSEVERVFGRKLPLNVLFQSATVASVAAELTSEPESLGLSTVKTLKPGIAATFRVPVFCVAAPEANSLGYIALGRNLPDKHPLYLLQSNHRNNRDRPYSAEELHEIAGTYIDAMRSACPHGPYGLAAMCEGVHIAFAMARQLQRNGENVPVFVSFDAWPEENTRTRLRLWLRATLKMRRECRIRDPKKLLRSAGRIALLSARLTSSWVRSFVRDPAPGTWDARYWPGRSFVPDRYEGEITVFRVKQQELYRVSRRDLGWGDWATFGARVHDVPGDHRTILREPNVIEVAEILHEQLEEIERRHSEPMPACSEACARNQTRADGA